MNIGNVIKKYRKELGITQEEMANRLGVTTPAVNKWENGNTNPDIGLLSPIARLLNISLDTLLSFHEKLTDTEIEEIIRKMYEEDQVDTFIEIGPGKALSGFVKRTLKGVTILNVEDMASLEKCLNNPVIAERLSK